jgi:transcriptional regulator with XRE-family HTH domain
MEIGQRLRRLRLAAGISRPVLGRMVSYTHDYVYKVESGKRNPSVQFLEAVARALQVPIAEILGGNEREGYPGNRPLALEEVLRESRLTYGGRRLTEEEREAIAKMAEIHLGTRRRGGQRIRRKKRDPEPSE